MSRAGSQRTQQAGAQLAGAGREVPEFTRLLQRHAPEASAGERLASVWRRALSRTRKAVWKVHKRLSETQLERLGVVRACRVLLRPNEQTRVSGQGAEQRTSSLWCTPRLNCVPL